MVKQTQAIRQLLPTNCLIVFDHYVGSALKRLSSKLAKCSFKKQSSEIHNKTLALESLSNKVAGLEPTTSLEQKLWQMFPCQFCKIFRNNFLKVSPEDCFYIPLSNSYLILPQAIFQS